jgi:hypothetical protein
MSKRARVRSFGDFATKGLDEGTLTIARKKLKVRIGEVPQNDLLFFPENPRVHSLLHADGTEPTQDEIQDQLEGMEHVKGLVQDIRRNGGLIDPLVVRSGTREVIEGNSRLAAYRCLAREDPIRWGKVKVTLLPEPVEGVVMDVLLGQYHLKGKTEWLPYEQAGYLYRRVHNHGASVDDLAAECGMSKQRIGQMIATYEFMVDKKDNVRARWSYYYEFIKSRKITKARKLHPKLDSAVVKMIRSGEIPRAQDLRDKLPVICISRGRALEKLVAGKLDFDDAYDLAEHHGGTNTPFRKLERFRAWLAESEVRQGLADSPPAILKRVAFEVKQLRRLLDALEKKLP